MRTRYLPKEQLRAKREIYLHSAEWAQIAQKAKQAGLPVSTFIRHAALGLAVQAIPSLVNVEAWRKLAPLATNLNTIAHALNDRRATGVDPLLLYEIGEQVRLLRLDLAGGAPS